MSVNVPSTACWSSISLFKAQMIMSSSNSSDILLCSLVDLQPCPLWLLKIVARETFLKFLLADDYGKLLRHDIVIDSKGHTNEGLLLRWKIQ